MKLCVPAEAPTLDAALDARLGRAACFVLVDSDSAEMVGSVPNVQNQQAASGAGVQSGELDQLGVLAPGQLKPGVPTGNIGWSRVAEHFSRQQNEVCPSRNLRKRCSKHHSSLAMDSLRKE